MKFFEILRCLLISPKKFINEFKSEKFLNIPHVYFFGIVFLLLWWVNRMDKLLVRISSNDSLPTFLYSIWNEWVLYWLALIFMSLFYGAVMYIIGPWFYWVRIKWSGAIPTDDYTKMIYIYSSVYIWLTTIVYTLFETFAYDRPILTFSFNLPSPLSDIESVLSLILMFLLFHSLWIWYLGAMSLKWIKKLRAIFWFLIIPGIIYSLSLGLLIFLS